MKKEIVVTLPPNIQSEYGRAIDPSRLLGITQVGEITLSLFSGVAGMKGRVVRLRLTRSQIQVMVRELLDLQNKMGEEE